MRGIQSNPGRAFASEENSEQSNSLIRIIAAFIDSRWSLFLLLLPIVILIPGLNSFPYPASGSPYSDITISHYPNLVYLRESLIQYGQIPLWSNTILSGYPFIANPLSGLMYPFGWPALITPLPLGFNVLVALHLIWGGLGLYLLLKQEGLRHTAALFSAMIFVLLPKIYSHYGAGHLTLLYAVPWTPWLLWSQARIREKNENNLRTVLPGLIFAFVVYADVRWAAFSALLWWFYAIVHRNKTWRKFPLNLLIQTLLGLLLAAPLLLPLAEYVSLSTRVYLEAQDILSFSLPISGLLGILFPNPGGFHEWIIYAGGLVTVLAIFAILTRGINRNIRFWAGGLVLSILIALGSSVPGFDYLAQLPLVSFLRVPSRSLFITGLSFAALAGYGLESAVQEGNVNWSTRRVKLTLFGLMMFAIAVAAGLILLDPELIARSIWGLVFLGFGAFALFLASRRKLSLPIWIASLFVITIVDLGLISFNSFQSRSIEGVSGEGLKAAQYLSRQPGTFRVYSPSYSIPQQTAVANQLQLADGIDPLQLRAYASFMETASGVPQDGYSVTLPPFENGDPGHDNAGYLPNPGNLGLLNVEYVVSEYPLDVDGLILETKFGSTLIYRNKYLMPRARVMQQGDDQANSHVPAEVLDSSSNRILISAKGPGSLVSSEVYYPGWHAIVDGEMTSITTFEGVLRKVELSPGEHLVEFRFKSLSLQAGFGLFLLGVLLLAWNFKPIR